MTLAAHLGRPSPTAMIEEMTGLDWMLWQTWLARHPIGELREDLRVAMQTAALVNLHIPKGKQRAQLQDYLFSDVRLEQSRPKQSWQEQLAIVKAMAMVKDPELLSRMPTAEGA